MSQKVKKAVFPVGGLGTRFLPATKSIPKEMLPVASKPLIQRAFEEAVEAGIEQFIFVTGRNKSAINNHFDHAFELQSVLSSKDKLDTLAKVQEWIPRSGDITFIPQKSPLGLGHAVWCARNVVGNEPFAVILADELLLGTPGLLAQMVTAYEQHGNNIVAAAEVPANDTHKYGILDVAGANAHVMEVKAMIEKPKPDQAPSNFSINGRYILQPSIFDYLGKQSKGSGDEIQLTDAMSALLENEPFYALRAEGQRFDCGHQMGFLEANIAYALAESNDEKEIKTILKKFLD